MRAIEFDAIMIYIMCSARNIVVFKDVLFSRNIDNDAKDIVWFGSHALSIVVADVVVSRVYCPYTYHDQWISSLMKGWPLKNSANNKIPIYNSIKKTNIVSFGSLVVGSLFIFNTPASTVLKQCFSSLVYIRNYPVRYHRTVLLPYQAIFFGTPSFVSQRTLHK
jgi:hypothetical protein